MILAFDTTNPEKTSVLLASSCHCAPRSGTKPRSGSRVKPGMTASGSDFKIIDKKAWGALENQSEELLPAIEAMLKKHQVELEDLKLIIVCKGPGSFTGTRIGISVANALSSSLKVPAVGVKAGKLNIEEIAKKGQELSKKGRKSTLVNPYYSKKPNITSNKQ